jgi:hypothetical protein
MEIGNILSGNSDRDIKETKTTGRSDPKGFLSYISRQIKEIAVEMAGPTQEITIEGITMDKASAGAAYFISQHLKKLEDINSAFMETEKMKSTLVTDSSKMIG